MSHPMLPPSSFTSLATLEEGLEPRVCLRGSLAPLPVSAIRCRYLTLGRPSFPSSVLQKKVMIEQQGKSLAIKDLTHAIWRLILDWRLAGAKAMNFPFCDAYSRLTFS